MFRRFAAACGVVSVPLAFAALVLFLVPGSSSRFYLLTHVWCFVPLIWGLWAMATPKAWVAQRLPLWGAILGLVLGAFLLLVLNLPSRVSGQELSLALRGFFVPILAGFYYLLWMFVRIAYRSLAPPA